MSIGDDNSVVVATLPFDQTTYVNQQTLSTNAFSDIPQQGIQADAQGNAVAAWGIFRRISLGKIFFHNGTWTLLPILPLDNIPIGIFLLSTAAVIALLYGWILIYYYKYCRIGSYLGIAFHGNYLHLFF